MRLNVGFRFVLSLCIEVQLHSLSFRTWNFKMRFPVKRRKCSAFLTGVCRCEHPPWKKKTQDKFGIRSVWNIDHRPQRRDRWSRRVHRARLDNNFVQRGYGYHCESHTVSLWRWQKLIMINNSCKDSSSLPPERLGSTQCYLLFHQAASMQLETATIKTGSCNFSIKRFTFLSSLSLLLFVFSPHTLK